MTTRFPKVCLRCASLDHYSEDCTRMPAGLGMAPQEREMMRMVAYQRSAILWAAVAVVGGLVLVGYLGGMPV